MVPLNNFWVEFPVRVRYSNYGLRFATIHERDQPTSYVTTPSVAVALLTIVSEAHKNSNFSDSNLVNLNVNLCSASWQKITCAQN